MIYWRIPSSFTLVNRQYNVEEMDPDVSDMSKAHGCHSRNKARILVELSGDLEEDFYQHTFLHELFHAMFEAAGKDDLSEDEDLVDLMAALLHQFLQTSSGDLIKESEE